MAQTANTQNTLERQVLRMIGEDADAPDAFSDITPIRDSINDAIEEIVMTTGSIKREYSLPLVAGTQFYTLTIEEGEVGWVTDAWLVNQKRRLDQTDMMKLDHLDPRWRTYNATPRSYYQLSFNIVGFYPISSSSTDVVMLTIAVIPKRYDRANDRIFVRGDYERACVHFAVSEYWASRGDARSAMFHYQKYLEKLGLRTVMPEAQENIPQFRTHKMMALQ